MWIRDKSRRVAGCLLAAALGAIPVVVSTIELGSPPAGAPSRHVVFDEASGVSVGSADWAFAPVCYGAFWDGRQTAAAWLAGWRYASRDPFADMRDGVAIVLSMTPKGASFVGDGSGGAAATGSVLGPVLASIVRGGSAGSGGSGGSGGGGGGGGAGGPVSGGGKGDAEAPGGDLGPLMPPVVMRPPHEEPVIGLGPEEQPSGAGGGGTTAPVSAVPVPAALPLLLTGLAALGFAGARRRTRVSTRPVAG